MSYPARVLPLESSVKRSRENYSGQARAREKKFSYQGVSRAVLNADAIIPRMYTYRDKLRGVVVPGLQKRE